MLSNSLPSTRSRARFHTRTLTPAVAQVVLAAVALCALEVALMYSTTPAPPWQVLMFPIVAGVYVAAGTVAWLRRPNNRIGPLLTATGFVWIAAGLFNVPINALIAVGLITATVPLAMVVHLLHAFPSGRLRGRLSFWTVVAGYFVCIVLQAPAVYLWQPNPLEIAFRPHLLEIGHWTQIGVGSVVVLVTAYVLAVRLRRMTSRQRWTLGPLYAYGIAAVLWIPAAANLHWLAPWDPLWLATAQMLALAGVPVAFVFVMLRGGFARTGELEELGAWLGEEEGGRPALADALADALGDPSLQLVYWIEETGTHVDAEGRLVVLPAAGAERAAVEVAVAGERIGAIVYDATLIVEPALVRAAGRVVALALERERLIAALRASRDRLRASRARVVEAADEERRRIARDLHDGLQTQLVMEAMKAHDLPGADDLCEDLERTITSLRELVHGVMPAALAEGGLYAAVEDLADAIPIPTRLELDEPRDRLPAPVESASYYLVSEAVANAVKHSHAHELRVRIVRDHGPLHIEVGDDGVGGAHAGAGAGLRGMAERIEALDGHLVIESPPGHGTLLVAEVPCGS